MRPETPKSRRHSDSPFQRLPQIKSYVWASAAGNGGHCAPFRATAGKTDAGTRLFHSDRFTGILSFQGLSAFSPMRAKRMMHCQGNLIKPTRNFLIKFLDAIVGIGLQVGFLGVLNTAHAKAKECFG